MTGIEAVDMNWFVLIQSSSFKLWCRLASAATRFFLSSTGLFTRVYAPAIEISRSLVSMARPVAIDPYTSKSSFRCSNVFLAVSLSNSKIDVLLGSASANIFSIRWENVRIYSPSWLWNFFSVPWCRDYASSCCDFSVLSSFKRRWLLPPTSWTSG